MFEKTTHYVVKSDKNTLLNILMDYIIHLNIASVDIS